MDVVYMALLNILCMALLQLNIVFPGLIGSVNTGAIMFQNCALLWYGIIYRFTRFEMVSGYQIFIRLASFGLSSLCTTSKLANYSRMQ